MISASMTVLKRPERETIQAIPYATDIYTIAPCLFWPATALQRSFSVPPTKDAFQLEIAQTGIYIILCTQSLCFTMIAKYPNLLLRSQELGPNQERQGDMHINDTWLWSLFIVRAGEGTSNRANKTKGLNPSSPKAPFGKQTCPPLSSSTRSSQWKENPFLKTSRAQQDGIVFSSSLSHALFGDANSPHSLTLPQK